MRDLNLLDGVLAIERVLFYEICEFGYDISDSDKFKNTYSHR